MEISEEEKRRLKSFWGAKAEAWECSALIRYRDNLTGWACYVCAMNPEDEDNILCLIPYEPLQLREWTFTELLLCFNINGEYIERDMEFRPMRLKELIKKLRGNYESGRNQSDEAKGMH